MSSSKKGGRSSPSPRSPRSTNNTSSRRPSAARVLSSDRRSAPSRAQSLETCSESAEHGRIQFAGQYQQTPAPAGGEIVKEAWFRRYRPEGRPASFDQIVQSWDTANKPAELADYSVWTTWGVKGPKFYLLNVLRKGSTFPTSNGPCANRAISSTL